LTVPLFNEICTLSGKQKKWGKSMDKGFCQCQKMVGKEINNQLIE